MADITLLYVTVPQHALAEVIGRTLVEESLAACVNILGDIGSIYRWEGKIEQAAEVALLVKTASSTAEAAIARIATLHPYACPAILALPVNGGFSPFLAWVGKESTA